MVVLEIDVVEQIGISYDYSSILISAGGNY